MTVHAPKLFWGLVSMKKTIAIFLIAALTAALCSCGSRSETVSQVAERYAGGVPALAGERIIFRRAAQPDEADYLPPEELVRLYYNGRPDAGEAQLLSDWYIIMSPSPKVAEVHVLRVRHLSDRTAVARMAEARARAMRSPELFAARSDFWGTRPEKAEVFCDGFDVILLCY